MVLAGHGPWAARSEGEHGNALRSSTLGSPSADARSLLAANANLVDQVREANERATAAEARRLEAEGALARSEARAPGSLVASKDEWTAAVKDERIRVRTPCPTQRSSVQFASMEPTRRSGSVSHRGDLAGRARAAGISDAELATLDEVYVRVHRKTWAKMATDCPVMPDARLESDGDDDARTRVLTTDVERIRNCQGVLLSPDRLDVKDAIRNVAELRARGAGFDRAKTAEARILYALSQSGEVLFEELKATFGREKAARIADYGIVCLDETVYSARETIAEGPVAIDVE
ncbi:MAG: hypothetical protein U0169_06190 [Polyangiaceae bacterium]